MKAIFAALTVILASLVLAPAARSQAASKPPTPISSHAASHASHGSSHVSNARGTECQRHREREANTKVVGALVPNCTADGKYEPLQCHGLTTTGKRFCQCWDPEGHIIRAPSTKVKACSCLLDKHRATNGGATARIGAFVPQCEETGHFKKRQCHGSTGHCWCVNNLTGEQLGEKKRGEIACA